MKQQDDWHNHLSPVPGHLSGIDVETPLIYALMAVAIIVSLAGLVICLAAFGLISASVTGDPTPIAA